jgi:hypothetical protein
MAKNPDGIADAMKGGALSLDRCASKETGEEPGESFTQGTLESIEELLNRLEITAEEEDAVDLSGMIEENRSSMKWAVIIRVRLKTSFDHTAFYQKMQVASVVSHEF